MQVPEEFRRLRASYEAYLLLERGLSPNTRDAYLRDADRLCNCLADVGTTVPDADAGQLQQFVAELHDLGIAPRSQARIISGMKSLYRFLHLEGIIDIDPTLQSIPHA